MLLESKALLTTGRRGILLHVCYIAMCDTGGYAVSAILITHRVSILASLVIN